MITSWPAWLAGHASNSSSVSSPWQQSLSYHLFFLPGFLSTGPSPGGASENEFQLTLLFLAFSLLVSYKCFFAGDHSVDVQIKASGTELKKLGDEYDSLAEEIHDRIEDLVNKQLDWVQHALNEKASSFRTFLQRMSQNPGCLGGSDADVKLAEGFALLANHWLTIFSQCSNHPTHKPYIVVDAAELCACTTVTEICNLILTNLAEDPIVLLEHPQHASVLRQGHLWDVIESTSMRPFDMDQPSVSRNNTIDLRDGCTWLQVLALNRYYVGERRQRFSWIGVSLPLELDAMFLKVVLITEVHALTFLTFVVGFFVSIRQVYLGDHLLSVLSLCGLSALLTVLFHYESRDPQGQLSKQTAQIEIERQDLEARHDAVTDFFNNVDRLSDLWTYRTRPCLSLLKEFFRKLETTPWRDVRDAQEFCQFAVNVTKMQAGQLGSLETWLEREERLSEDACKILRKELDRCCSYLRNSAVSAALSAPDQFNILSLVAVRIVQGMDLHPGTLYDVSDPYVQVRVGRNRVWQRTPTVLNCQSPEWHYAGLPSEFHFNVPTNTNEPLVLEVRDDDYAGPHQLLGTAQLHFRKLEPGEWHHCHVELKDAEQGELVFDAYYASSAEHLLGLVPPEPPPPTRDDEVAGDEAVVKEDGVSSEKADAPAAALDGVYEPDSLRFNAMRSCMFV
eukprot:TRINITY_DN34866_c0_g1_i3.p1 TRINITY_DN34866_c0_g1~~TRINITY_DN34866_c0_g1_i3.p1  ORF type:complete len:677 (-),score=80.57 TRINITY_DN34866_c0_g1_i3:33-2063(-)